MERLPTDRASSGRHKFHGATLDQSTRRVNNDSFAGGDAGAEDDLAPHDAGGALPREGLLSFFYATDGEPKGTADDVNPATWRVLHLADPVHAGAE